MSAAVPDRSRHSSYMHCITKRNALRIERVSVLWEQNPYEPIERSQAFELTYWTYEDVDCLQLTQESGRRPLWKRKWRFWPHKPWVRIFKVLLVSQEKPLSMEGGQDSFGPNRVQYFPSRLLEHYYYYYYYIQLGKVFKLEGVLI